MASAQVATPVAAGRKASGTPTAEGSRSTVRPVKLFIGGLTRNTTTKQLRDHFAQYGRILDCVAMRQPDGRPRGFGYVTLDSPAAAERCLAEPQVVDGRVVDMKRAVPGNACGNPGANGYDASCLGTSPSSLGGAKGHAGGASPFFPPGAWDMASYFGAAAFPGTPHSPSAAWAAWAAASSPKAGAEMLDCLDVLRRGVGAPPSPAAVGLVETPSSLFRQQASNAAVCESLGLLTGAPAGRRASHNWSNELRGLGANSPDATPTAAGGLSASAPEFVPRTTTAAAAKGRRSSIGEDTPQKVELPTNAGQRRRSVLGDVTNLVSGSGYPGMSPVKAPLPSAIKGGSIRSALDLENVATPPTAAQAKDDDDDTAVRSRGGRPAPAPLAVFEDGADDEKDCESSGESSGVENHEVAAAGAEQPRPEAKTPRAAFPCSLPPGLSPPRHLKQADRDLPVAAAAPALTLPGILSTVPSSSPVAAGATAAPRTWTPTSAAAMGKSVTTQTASTQCAFDDDTACEEGGRERSGSDDSCASSFSREELLRLRAPALLKDDDSEAAAAAPEPAEAATEAAAEA